MLESFFNLEYCKIFKSTYFEEHLRMAASEYEFMKLKKIKNHRQVKLYISLLFYHDWFALKFVFTYNISLTCISKLQTINM